MGFDHPLFRRAAQAFHEAKVAFESVAWQEQPLDFVHAKNMAARDLEEAREQLVETKSSLWKVFTHEVGLD